VARFFVRVPLLRGASGVQTINLRKYLFLFMFYIISLSLFCTQALHHVHIIASVILRGNVIERAGRGTAIGGWRVTRQCRG